MKRALLIIWFILVSVAAYSSPGVPAVKKAAKAMVKTDTSSTVSIRRLDSAALKAYSKQHEFQYVQAKEPDNWLQRFGRWLWNLWLGFKNWLRHLFSSEPTKNAKINNAWIQILKYTFIALGVFALAFLIFKLLGIDMLNVFRKKSASVPIPYSEFFEDINAISFDTEIENAVAKQNYRFAVRLLYLKCLKQLSDAGLIKWQIDKTNSAYISELNNDEQRAAFSILTRQFEYVWYGEFLIDAPIYTGISSSFQDFNKHVA